MPDTIGKIGLIVHTVKPADLATYWKNDIPVLATPILLWLAELASMKAVEGLFNASKMTVGIAHNSQHLAPTPVGFTVKIRATVKSATAKRILFDVEATDGLEIILSGTHTRAIVDREIFAQHTCSKEARKPA
ncbi:hypothetical protein [Pseudomonas sp.]|uniref:thioesterase family protein n=1 Tax=Pseudomonas sp. TaxID=306 RepID=UPI0026026F4F|nr:hypothetical protein [Pseudomonas sp.]